VLDSEPRAVHATPEGWRKEQPGMGTVGARAGARLGGSGRRAPYGSTEGVCKRWALGDGGKSG